MFTLAGHCADITVGADLSDHIAVAKELGEIEIAAAIEGDPGGQGDLGVDCPATVSCIGRETGPGNGGDDAAGIDLTDPGAVGQIDIALLIDAYRGGVG
jgi:hypothetical protein